MSPDPDFDPDEMNKMHWISITIPFKWIAKIWKKVFGKEEEKNERD